ncbi:MAG: PQQ-binding-like beta-propeller repeat protein [Acidobacteriota bacterium]
MSSSWTGPRSRQCAWAAALVVAAAGCAISIGVSAAESRWWLDYAGGPASSRYFASREINQSNVGKLTVAWTYPYGETGFNAIVANGTIYGRGRNGAIVALDAKTGKEIWIHDAMQAMSARGMNYWESKNGTDRRLIFSMNDYLQEIDARTGLSITAFGKGGVVDLRQGLGRDPATIGRIQSGTPGKIFENSILLGSATGEGYLSPPGDLRAYDVLTGALLWQFHTVPHPDEFGYETWPKDAWKYIGGTNTWGEITVDAKRGIAYFPTGSPTYDYYGADRPGENLFANCLLALDARTGKRLWHFQSVHHDLWDFDNNAAPQLTTIRKGGKAIDVVAMAGKTGFLYVFDRVTGAPIWPIEERPVPKSEMPGEQSWPTQPFPTVPPPFVKQAMTIDEINPHAVVTDAARAAFKERLGKARNLGLFTPIDFVDTVHIPGSNGGALFGYTAAEPDSGNVYVIGQNNPGVLKLLKPTQAAAGTLPGQAVYLRECQVCHGADRSGTQNGPTLLTVPGNVDAASIRETVTSGKGRMPAFPHLNDVDLETLATFLSVLPPGARGRGAGAIATFAAGPVVASGGAQTREVTGRGRGGARPYPEGVEPTPQYVIDAYGTIGIMMKPPFTSLTKYDLNTGTIRWQVGLGDDARLAALGITGTGVTQMRSSLIVTGGGLIFAPGGDSRIRAFDTDTGKVLWTAAVGGAIRGGPSMYESDGKQYLLVAASGDIPVSGAVANSPPPANLPAGYVAFALPAK